MSEAPRHRRRCPGRQLSGGWKKTSVNVSLARDSCAAGNYDGAARRELILKSNKKKYISPVEVKQGNREGGREGLRGITDRRATPSSLRVKGKSIIIAHVIKCNPADNLTAPMSDRLTNKSDN